VARAEALVLLREPKSPPWRSVRRVQGGTIPPLLGEWDGRRQRDRKEEFSDPS
jgi:hypothetical protein